MDEDEIEPGVARVEGTIKLTDGSTTQFLVFANGGSGGWSQWGTVGKPGDFVDALDAIVAGLLDGRDGNLLGEADE